MRRMTLAQIRLRKRLLPRFRRLAFESLYDRITLDASLPEFVADGEVLPDREPWDYVACEYMIADDELQEDEEIVECELLPGELETESGEPIEWELLALEDYEETSEEQWIDGSEGSNEVDGEVIDPVAWETGEGEEYVMYSFMTGVGEVDAGEVVTDIGELETQPDDESMKILDETPLEDYVVSAEGEYLPLSAVERTSDDVDAPPMMAGGLAEIFETTVVEESPDNVAVAPIPDSSAGTVEIVDPFEPAEITEVVESAPVLEVWDTLEFLVPESDIVEVELADVTDLQTYVPAIAMTSVIEVSHVNPGIVDPLVNAAATDSSSALQLAATSDLARPSNPGSQEDESDESTLIRRNPAPVTTTAAIVISEEEEELPAEDEAEAEKDKALAEVEEDAADTSAE